MELNKSLQAVRRRIVKEPGDYEGAVYFENEKDALSILKRRFALKHGDDHVFNESRHIVRQFIKEKGRKQGERNYFLDQDIWDLIYLDKKPQSKKK